MASLTIKKSSNFLDVENYFRRISDDPSVELRPSNSLKEKGVFGIEGLVLLLLATWLRNNKGDRILHSFSKTDKSFDELCGSLFGICILRMSDVILLDDRKDEVAKEVALKSAYESVRRVISEDFRRAFKGGYLAIPSIKAPGKNSEYNSPFYNGDRVVGRDKFREITVKAIDAVVPQAGRKAMLGQDVISNISEIVRELFSNTDKHARRDQSGNLYQENYRAVIFNAVEVSKDRLVKLMGGGGGPLANFAVTWLPEGDGKLSVLDITVVDSGPGYARRWCDSNNESLGSFESEASAVVNCFSKHSSRDSRESSGSGLTNVLSDLKRLKGWFRLRTGGCLVERSYLFEDDNKMDVGPEDVIKKNSFVEGVSFNVVIPLRVGKGET